MKKILSLLLLLFAFILPGCGGGPPTQPCYLYNYTANSSYQVSVTKDGKLYVFNGFSDAIGTILYYSTVGCGNVTNVIRLTFSNLSLSASPTSIDLLSPPSTATITGDLFDTTYGMPRVEYFAGNGYLVGSVYATSVSGSTSLTANVPDLSSAYSGSYVIRVTNKTYQGYYAHTVGIAGLSAYGRDRMDSDSDGYYDDEDCDPYDASRNGYCNDCPEDPFAIVCP
jgi:hypothetical protein